MLAKIDVWFSSRKVQKAMAKISPDTWRGPRLTFSALQNSSEHTSLDDYDHPICYKKRLRLLSVLQQRGGLSLFWRFFGADGLAPLLHVCQNPCPVSG